MASRTGLRLAYRGNFQPKTAPFEARWSTEHQLALTLEAMGHIVVRLQEDEVDWDECLTEGLRSDGFMWTQTWNLDPDGGFLALAALEEANVPSFGVHLDLFWGLSMRRPGWIDEPYWRMRWLFTADGGHDAEWAAAGVNHLWLPPGIFAPHAHRGRSVEPYNRFPVAFVGTARYPHPEWADQRREMLDWVRVKFGPLFRPWAGGIRGEELCDLYASAQIVVGDSCLAGQIPRFWSDRIPETLGRGGFLIHPHVEGIEDSFQDGVHLRLFESGDWSHLMHLISYYLAHPAEAREIADRGQQLVQSRDTYNSRMETVLATVFDRHGLPRPVPRVAPPMSTVGGRAGASWGAMTADRR